MTLDLDRRSYLKLAAGGGAASLAGCTTIRRTLGLEFGDPGERPAYADWLAPVGADGEDGEGDADTGFSEDADVLAAYVDVGLFASANEGGDGETPTTTEPGGTESDDGSPTYEDDPLLAYPMSGLLLGAVSSLTADAYGVGWLFPSIAEEGDPDSRADEVIVDHDTAVFVGDVDPGEVETALTEGSLLVPAFERTGAVEGYDLYTPVEEGENRAAAVGEDAVVLAETSSEDAEATVRTTVRTKAGEEQRAVEAYDELDWLLRSAGNGHFSVVAYGEEEGALQSGGTPTGTPSGTGGSTPTNTPDAGDVAAGVVEGGRGFASSGSVLHDGPDDTDPTGVQSTVAAYNADYDPEDATESLGFSATTADVSFDGDRIYATGTWDDAEVARSLVEVWS